MPHLQLRGVTVRGCLLPCSSFLEACVPTKAYTLLKPNLGFILQSVRALLLTATSCRFCDAVRVMKITRVAGAAAQVIAPLCGFTDEDQELWVDDPHEFVRMQYNPQKDQQSPRDMAEQLLCTLVAVRLVRVAQYRPLPWCSHPARGHA